MTHAVAILPARGGSKRIPHKNIKPFAGRPAIAWPIAAARASGCFSRIVVSTDDTQIAEIASRFGAEAPFLREAALADDYTGTTEVVRDAVARLDLSAGTIVACLYPTAFFLEARDLQSGQAKVIAGARWSMAVAAYPTPIDRAYRMEGDLLVPRQPDMMPKRSQDLAPAYFDVGQFYFAEARTWLDPEARIWDGAAGVEIPFERAIDIDTPEDWTRAEHLHRLMAENTGGPKDRSA